MKIFVKKVASFLCSKKIVKFRLTLRAENGLKKVEIWHLFLTSFFKKAISGQVLSEKRLKITKKWLKNDPKKSLQFGITVCFFVKIGPIFGEIPV